MKIIVFGGSGKMGAAVAWDLVKQKDVAEVALVGRRKEALKAVRDWVGSDKITMLSMDIADGEAAKAAMQRYDVGISTLPDRRTSYLTAHAAVEAGLDIVDMLEEFHRRPDAYETEGLVLPKGMSLNDYGDWLHDTAIKNDVTLLSGIGFAPGISNITVGEGIRKLDKAETAVARVGGIPSKESSERHPLRYMITWAFRHVLREYKLKVEVIKDGKIVEVDAMSDLEPFRFTKFGKDEALEAAITPGMPSFVFTRPELQEFSEKTVRWPGHWQGIATLKECGLLDTEPVEVDGVQVVPRELLYRTIEPRLQPLEGDTDACVMWNSVVGEKKGRKHRIDYYMWDEADTENGISSMGRVTGFSAAVGALFVARGLITEKGIVAPEDCFDGERYDLFIEGMRERGIDILEESADVA